MSDASNAVPEGWSVQPLDGKVDILSGFPFKSSLFCDDASRIGLIRIRDLVKQSLETFYDGDFDEAYVVRKGDILIGMDGDFNIVKWKARDALLNQRICKVKASKGSEFDSNFIFYSLIDDLEAIHSATGATTVKHLSVKDIRGITKAYPPLPEQQKIATILSSVDEVIEKTRAQIDKLKDLKTGMMQELLTKGIGHTEFKDSPVGRIPAVWDVCSANDVAEEIMVGVVIKPTQYYVESGVPALRSANVRENGLTMDNLKYFSIESNEILKKSKLKKGDLLTVRTGYPGTTAVVTDEFEGCNCIDVVITRPSSNMDSNFFSLWVNSDSGKGQVLKAQGGLAQQHFNVGDMKNLMVVVPPLAEQIEIFEAVNSVITRISLTEKRLRQLNNIKKALMQDLLTGKVRVNVENNQGERVAV